jgi:hypothetical protein
MLTRYRGNNALGKNVLYGTVKIPHHRPNSNPLVGRNAMILWLMIHWKLLPLYDTGDGHFYDTGNECPCNSGGYIREESMIFTEGIFIRSLFTREMLPRVRAVYW